VAHDCQYRVAVWWDIAIPLAGMGSALPFFFSPTTTRALGSVEEYEMDMVAGLMNFLRSRPEQRQGQS
jgi:DHA2 family multidrug resistance protein